MRYKYINIALAAAALSATCNAGITKPVPSYSMDFSTLGNNGDELPGDWATFGKGYRPLQEWQDFFDKDGNGPYFRLLNLGGCVGAFSNSSFIEDIAADEWLVTPAIHINNDDELLVMTVGAYGSFKLNDYRIFVSDKGNSKEDFDSAPIAISTLYGSTESPNLKKTVTPLRGYAGKDIHVAFVNRSKDAALLGVTDINISPYFMDVTDNTPLAVPADENFQISVSTRTYTTSNVKGMRARLEASNGIKNTIEISKTILPSGTQTDITFPDIFVMGEENIDYTVTLTPNYEDAEPTIITGTVTRPYTSYPPVAVVEEFTGTWCTFCPRGAAFMDYYHDKYNGGDNGKVIGIAIHSGDIMEMSDNSYLSTAQRESGASGFPSAFFSRHIQDDPSTEDAVTSILAQQFYSYIGIDKVSFNPDMDDFISVDFNVENAYSKNELDQRVSFVIVENDVKGDTPDYNQTNYFSGVPRQTIIATYGEELWPYFESFSKATNPALFTMMKYQHVARGIYPDYYGTLLNGSCEAGQPLSFSVSFPKPDKVLDWDNISLIAILTDNRTGKIIYADEMEASLFNNDSGVETYPDSELSAEAEIFLDGNSLNIRGAAAPMSVEIYGIDGTKRGSYSTDNTEISIPASTLDGVAIVSVKTSHGITVRKIVF